MKQSFFTIAILICLALLPGCNKSAGDVSDFKYEIVISDTLDEPSWYDLFESVSYIPLKTDIPMGQIDQIVVRDGLMYVIADGLFCFDMEGNCKFGNINKGRARNEFLKPSSLSVYDGKVFVYDMFKNQMLVFDAQSGSYIDSFDVPGYMSHSWFNGASYICKDMDPKDGCFFKCYSKDDTNILTSEFFARKEDVGVMVGSTSWANDGLLCLSYIKNCAWKINGTDTVPYIKVTVPENKRLSDNAIPAMLSEYSSKGSYRVKDYATGVMCGLYYVTECDGFITGMVTDYEDSDFNVFFIYDKNTGHSYSYKRFALYEPWYQNPISERDNPAAGDGDCIYVVSSYDEVTRKILGEGNEPEDPKYRQAYEVYKSLTIDSNPFVARFELKEIK